MHQKLTLTVTSDCLLQGASGLLVDALKRQLTLANPKYRDAKKYGRWIGKRLKPYLYFYEETDDGIRFPRGFANHAVRMCRNLERTSPVIIDRRRSVDDADLVFSGKLRPYQAEAVQAILKRDFGVLEAGTGSGKTVIALAVTAGRKQPALVLVHTKELLYQWAERVETFLGIQAGLVGDGHYHISPVTIAIVNTARTRLAELPKHFGQICVDECHRVPATLFTEVLKAFDSRFSLGLSATAYRRDGLTDLIYYYLGERVFRIDQKELHETGAVLRPEFIQRPTGFTYTYRGNYQALIKALTADEDRNRLIVEDIIKESRGGAGTVLVVSDRVAHCEKLAALLADRNIQAAVLTGRLRSEERSALVDAIQNGGVNILISTMQLIGEGFDCPGLRSLFLTTPIKFTGRLLQVVGRILRPGEEGKSPRVFDYVDPVGVLKSSARNRSLAYQENL